MAFLVSTVEVESYENWRGIFNNGEETRRELGLGDGRVYQDVGDANKVTVILEGNLSDLQAYAGSKTLKDSMADAGVVGAPQISFASDVT